MSPYFQFQLHSYHLLQTINEFITMLRSEMMAYVTHDTTAALNSNVDTTKIPVTIGVSTGLHCTVGTEFVLYPTAKGASVALYAHHSSATSSAKTPSPAPPPLRMVIIMSL